MRHPEHARWSEHSPRERAMRALENLGGKAGAAEVGKECNMTTREAGVHLRRGGATKVTTPEGNVWHLPQEEVKRQ